MGTERRRSERYALLREEIAVVHDLHLDRPATLIDFSATGALISLLDVAGLPDCRLRVNDRVKLSLQAGQSAFYVDGRIVRRGPSFVAVEFAETCPEALLQIGLKVERLSAIHAAEGARAAGA